MKAKCLKFLGLVVAPPAIIFPWLNYKDSSLTIVDLEGSGSLFDPILFLTREEENIQFNILPTGSAGGKESLSENSINLALTSLSSKQAESSSNQFKEVRIAEDPIVLIHKKNSNCSLINSNKENKELLSSLFSLTECSDLVLFLREGGYERSNLNKTVLETDTLLDFNISQIREVPENNFLAFEKFQRENYLNAIIFFPSSFVNLNKDLFSNYQTKELRAKPSQKSPRLQKELNLLYRKGEDVSKNNLWGIIKKILLKSKELNSSFQLKSQHYCDSTSENQKCNNVETPEAKDINQLRK